jgi:hypothetical protein
MTDEHKAALAQGRVEGRAVRDYLESLRANKPKRGRRRTPETIKKRMDAIDAELLTADPLAELKLRQERRNLEDELHARTRGRDHAALEKGFIMVARSYSERQGISYSAWREVGVDAAVLKKAGITRKGN